MSRFVRNLVWLLPAAAVIQIVILAGSSLPLGVPGEWTWTRTPAEAIGEIAWFPLLLTTIFYIGWLCLGDERIPEAPRRVFVFWLLMLAILAVVQLWSIRSLPAGIFNHSGQIWVTYYPRMSGYFTQATSTERTLEQFLADYEEEVRQGDYLHQGTHPPGLPVGFLIARQTLEQNPDFTDWLNSWQPPDVALGIDTLGELAQMQGGTLSRTERGLLWGHLLFSYLVAVATLLPLAAICRGIDLDRRTTWWLAGTWTLLPALTVFMPKSDVLFPFLAASTVAAFLWSSRAERNLNRGLLGLLAGLTFWLGIFCSLAFVALLPILGIWWLLEGWRSLPAAESKVYQRAGEWLRNMNWPGAAGFLTACILATATCWLAFDLNLLQVWAINLSKHAEFYDHNSRTYGLWLPVNVLELGFSLGLPVFVLIVCGGFSLLRSRPDSRQLSFGIAVLATWAALWLSGKNMGEAARLWIFLLPLWLPLAGVSHNEQPAEKTRSLWLALLISQTIVTAVAAVVLDGFGFSDV